MQARFWGSLRRTRKRRCQVPEMLRRTRKCTRRASKTWKIHVLNFAEFRRFAEKWRSSKPLPKFEIEGLVQFFRLRCGLTRIWLGRPVHVPGYMYAKLLALRLLHCLWCPPALSDPMAEFLSDSGRREKLKRLRSTHAAYLIAKSWLADDFQDFRAACCQKLGGCQSLL